jgi:hypothetical protein
MTTHMARNKKGSKFILEETRNNTAWNNQLKGLVTRTRNGRHVIRNRKSADEQLITHFLDTLETAFSIGHGRTSKQTHQYPLHRENLSFQNQTGFKHKGKQKRTRNATNAEGIRRKKTSISLLQD